MSEATACADGSPAGWLLSQNREWWNLTARGPLGFDRYARLLFLPDPAFVGQREGDAAASHRRERALPETQQIGVAVSRLARHTATPQECYFLLWEGWPDVDGESRRLGAARIDIGDEYGSSVRGYYLFRGGADLLDWGDRSVASLTAWLPVPAFVWPADRAWCITRDVDPHFATIGAGAEAIAEVLGDPRIDVVEDDPAIDPPRYF